MNAARAWLTLPLTFPLLALEISIIACSALYEIWTGRASITCHRLLCAVDALCSRISGHDEH